ncbi:MAG: methyltransferase domain-containing protein [Xanthomonadales bacterium]|nr:methyltransferase domain-containing protein [Xanthomonadales bacterium]
MAPSDVYAARLAQERAIFAEQKQVHDLPEIFHYWSNTHLRPMMEAFGFSNPDQFYARYLPEAARRVDGPARFVSLGSGNCDTEVRVAALLRDMGLQDFVIECLDINEDMLERGRALAREAGLQAQVLPLLTDFNQWSPEACYAAAMANQSLHHVVELERLFDSVRQCLLPRGLFLTSDMVGRNGHQRWPEALRAVWGFWHELPAERRYNLQLERQEDWFENWDCSGEGFEGIRAQDILPLLLERFHFELFLPYGNIIDPFIDRSFGHHFDAASAADRAFIDRVHARDEAGILAGEWTPTHLVAVLCLDPPEMPLRSRGLQPEDCVRPPEPLWSAPPTQSLSELTEFLGRCGGTDEPYLSVHYPRFRQVHELVSEGPRARRVLDVGAHWLHQTLFYTEQDAQVFAVDGAPTFSLPSVQEAARRAGIRLLQEADLESAQSLSQIPESSIDLILFTEIIEHLTFNPVAMWQEIYRVLAPGGRIIVTTPNFYALGSSAWHLSRFLRWRGAGIPIEHILGKRTLGHHWKEYSMAELVGYFRLLSTDFRVRRAEWLEAPAPLTSRHWRPRLSRWIERHLRWFRPNLYLELDLPQKEAGITLEPEW